ncbi:MAG TPA: DUF6485 family protein [Candidatus Omnitrophota bacterium]|nr:DUF6485 family protein [Candidatus Omnitrophota bacterium]HQL42193.1 DUF6485 family protein [Candidatus Omnitrophota bacterium]
MNCPNKQRNMQMCNCTYPGCEKHGICCECLHYHRQKGALPACFFPPEAEKTYDRSIAHFLKIHQK